VIDFAAAGLRDWYPGLSRFENAVWGRWLEKHLAEVDGIAYSVSVGEGREVESGLADWLARDWYALTRLRVDAVVRWSGAIWVVEVKDRQSMSALGQCLVYAELLWSTYGLSEYPGMLHVCALAHRDFERAFKRSGILVEVV
jgi:hypothetical protein